MSNHILYKFSDGREAELCITTKRAIMLEEWLKASVLSVVKGERIDTISAICEILAAGYTEEKADIHEAGKELAMSIYDDMREQGKTLQDFQFLALDLLVSAGFIPAAFVEAQRAAITLALKEQERMAAEMEKTSEA